MTEYRPFAAWLRYLAGLLALAGALGLAGCGGGHGAPNNVFNTPGDLAVLPGSPVIAYSGTPTVLTISGGTPPYKAFSSNSGLLPVEREISGDSIVLFPPNVAADTDVVVTVQDSPPGTTPEVVSVNVTVRAAPLLNSLTITPTEADCGTTAICSGEEGTATVTVLGPQGAPIAGRAVRFDVVSGPFLIKTTNPAQPLVTSLVVVSDQNGIARVIIKANANAPTEFAQLQVTDLTSGQRITGSFLIQQVTDGSKILTIVPNDVNIKGAFKGECSRGFRVDYFIYGGTPPYRVTSTFPSAITLSTMTVNMEGGFFEAITNGSCVDPLTFSIVDASGRQTTATLHNVEGTTERPVVVAPALAITPTSITDPACTGKTFTFVVLGGTPPYSVKPTAGMATPQTVATNGGSTAITGLLTGSGNTTIVFLDSTTPQKTVTATITCS